MILLMIIAQTMF